MLPTMGRRKRTSGGIRGLEWHGRSYRWRRMVNGKRLRVNLETADYDEAVAKVLELEGRTEVIDGAPWEEEVDRYIAEQKRMGKLSEAYGRSRRTVLKKAGRDMGVTAPRELTAARVRAWYAAVTKERSAQTANHYLAHVRVFARWLVKRQRLLMSPVEEVESAAVQGRTRSVFVPAERVRELLDAAREEDAELELILLLGFECGMRHGEMSAARGEWVDLAAGTITIPAAEVDGTWSRKGRTGRKKAVTVPLVARLREWFDAHGVPRPYLLQPEVRPGRAVYRYDFRKKVAGFFRRQGLEGVWIHDMRRSFGSNRVSAGVSIEKVANWMGIHPGTAWRHYARFMPADREIERGSAGGEGNGRDERAGNDGGPGGGRSVGERLREVQGLREEGLISEEEEARVRAEILREL